VLGDNGCYTPETPCPIGYTGTYPNCVPPVVIDVCENLPGDQSSLPEGYTQNGENCYSQNECSDGVNNEDGDELSDSNDPGCWTDGETPESYDPNDNDETDGQGGDNPSDEPTSRSSGGSRRTPRSSGEVLGAETSVCNWDVNTYMRKGYKNNVEQVKILQRDLLNGYMKFNLSVDGVYGPKTEEAVKAFQMLKKDKILTPWNLTLPTGIFYKTTLVEAKNTICPDVILPIPTDLINWSRNLIQVPPRA
jgi:hypothetical protein